MNVPGVIWCCNPANYRKAFARIYVIVHGGPAVAAKLKALGLPPYRGPELAANPFPRVRILWSPLSNNVDATPYWPGNAYVDVGGADIYKEASGDPPWAKFDQLYKFVRAHHKPFAVPEWGLYGIDDPKFVHDMCTFLKTHVTESEEFFTSKPGSIFDLGNKPKSRAVYKRCITRLAAPLPPWALGGAGSAKVLALSLAPVTGGFAVAAKLTVPIVHWELDFGDGAVQSGAGTPPASIPHSYAADHIYEPVLVVYASLPFTPSAIRFFATAAVGSGAPALLLAATALGAKVSFHLVSSLANPVTSWTLLYGDGLQNAKTGALPHFAGHTYPKPGTYTVVLVANLAGSGRVIETTSVTVS
jgi:hypothetical protein